MVPLVVTLVDLLAGAEVGQYVVQVVVVIRDVT